jgi:hypothetical protein
MEPTITGTLIVQDGEYLIVNEAHRTIARSEEIGLRAYRKTPRGFQSANGDTTETEYIPLTISHINAILNNGGTVKLLGTPSGDPQLINGKIIILN